MPWMVCEKLNDFCTSTTYATMPNTMQAEMMDVVVASAAISFVNRPKLAPSSVPHDAMALPQASIGSALTVFFAPSAMSTKYMRISKNPVPHDKSVLISVPFTVAMDSTRNPATEHRMDSWKNASGEKSLRLSITYPSTSTSGANAPSASSGTRSTSPNVSV